MIVWLVAKVPLGASQPDAHRLLVAWWFDKFALTLVNVVAGRSPLDAPRLLQVGDSIEVFTEQTSGASGS